MGQNTRIGDMLKGKRGLVVGVAKQDSIAFGCASKLRAFGAEIALTYLNDKAKPYVSRLAQQLDTTILLPLDVTDNGAEKVVDYYNVMGPIKAALEATVRYLASELGEHGIRVFAVSPGPIKTRASSGIADFNELINIAIQRSPAKRIIDIAEVGRVVGFLVGGGSSGMTGDVIYVDAGLHIMA